MYKDRLYVPKVDNLHREILKEARNTPYTAHPGGPKMYSDLKEIFWWRNMKQSIGQFMERCLMCQQVKAEHQQPSRLLNQLEILEGK